MASDYIGRFAPSPTGPLHMGSLLAALASYLDAKSQDGQWLVRIEDLDPPREEPGASEKIIDCLNAHHLFADGDICFQSKRHQLYQSRLKELLANDHIYPCQCSRQQLQVNDGKHGTRCQNRGDADLDQIGWAWRISTDKTNSVNDIYFGDRLQGAQQQNIHQEVGDFVLRRKDNLFAYQLAVVADDIAQGVNSIVRGSDLLSSTARQIFLYTCLNEAAPSYCHIPLILNEQGQKLSKQNHAPPLNTQAAPNNIRQCLTLLGHPPPATLKNASCQALLDWGTEHWQLSKIPPKLSYTP